jgi:hypothetical protein
LDALASTWARAAYGTEHSAKELAVAFRRALQAHPELVGQRLKEWAIKRFYPLLCRSLRVEWPPPYKDFLKELAEEMPRKRHDLRRNGRRGTYTTYLVPDPNAAVVALSKRKRA